MLSLYPHFHGEPKYAFGRTVLQALLSMSPGFGTLGHLIWQIYPVNWTTRVAGSVCLAQLYVAVTPVCMSIKQVLGGVALCDCYKHFPFYIASCRGLIIFVYQNILNSCG